MACSLEEKPDLRSGKRKAEMEERKIRGHGGALRDILGREPGMAGGFPSA